VFEPVRLFLIWWRDEMLTFVPRRLRIISSESKGQLVIEINDDRAAFYDVRGGRPTVSGEIPLKDSERASVSSSARKIVTGRRRENRDVVVSLPQDWVLTRMVRLPAIAEKTLLHSISFQLERCTPFKSDEVYYGAEIQGRDEDAKEIRVTLQIVAKSMVDGALATLAGLGLRPRRMSASRGGGGEFQGINLLPNNNREHGNQHWASATVAFALLATVLAATAIWLPLEQKRQEASRLAERIVASLSEVKSAEQLEAEIDRLNKRVRFLPEQQLAHPPAVQALNELTELLPDDTWLFQLQFRNPQLEIQGYSSSASKVIEIIENSPAFRNPTFSSKVTRDSKIGGERFHIRFETVAGGSK